MKVDVCTVVHVELPTVHMNQVRFTACEQYF